MDAIDFSHGGNIFKMKRTCAGKLLDFSANMNPLGLPPRVKETIYKNFGSILHYPDPEAKKITRGIAEYWGIKEENILVGNGSAELIYLIVSAFRPKVTLIPVPTFSEYERAARCAKSRIRFLRLKEELGFKLDDIKTNKADILFLCNPNNPTGNLIFTDFQEIERLPVGLIVVDEAFMDFLPDEKKHTLIRRAQENKRIIVLRTLTKFFALPGLRIGYLVAHRSIADKLRQYKIPWSVNVLAQAAAERSLTEHAFMRRSKQYIEKERSFLYESLKQIKGLKPYPSVTNFLLIKIEDERMSSTRLKERLLKKGIFIRDCANFRGLNTQFVRVAVRLHKENILLMRALKECV